MRITGLAAPIQALLNAALPKVATFSVTDPPVENAAMPVPVGQPVSVELLVALAASEPSIDRRRRSAAQADRSLSALERLHLETLAGVPTVEGLREIAALSQTIEDHADPALAGLLKDIELRMRVELAKHDIVA